MLCNHCLCLTINQQDSVLVLECKARAKEGQDCQAFMKVFGVAIQAYLPETNRTLMDPVQLLTGDVPLAAILGMSATSQLWAVTSRGPVPAAFIPSASETPALLMGMKCQHRSSDQGVPMPRPEEEETAELDNTPEE